MVKDHWSNDGMVSMDRTGLEQRKKEKTDNIFKMRNYGNKGLVVRGNVAAIDNAWLERFSLSLSHKMFLKKKVLGKCFWSQKKKNADKVHQYTFEMRNYGNKGLVVGERWLLLTVDDYRSPTAKRKAHSVFFVRMTMIMMVIKMTMTKIMTTGFI